MAGQNIPNLDYLAKIPVFGPRLAETIKAVVKQVKNVAQQTNATPASQTTEPPPQVHAVSVVASGGVAHIQITDENTVYRGITYHVQYATDPGFSAPCNGPSGPSRDIRIPVGTQPLYYRVFSDYPTSAPSPAVYFGGAIPVAVAATGTAQPTIPAGQGSGTGFAGQISGHGPVPYRGDVPPKRS
jgi:hypothetical protein